MSTPARKIRMVLETERLQLRELTTDDAQFMLDLLNEPSFIQNIGDRGVRTLEDSARYLERGPVDSYNRHGFGVWMVELKDGGDEIGICGLIKRDGLEDVDLGFSLFPRYWSKGYAVEAASAVVRYAAASAGLKRLVAIVSPANAASIRVLEKVGMSFERMIQLPGDPETIRLYGMTLQSGDGVRGRGPHIKG